MLVKVANKNTRTVISALIKQSKKLPNELYKSLTWDRGKELMDHRRFSLATDIDVYFCEGHKNAARTAMNDRRNRIDFEDMIVRATEHVKAGRYCPA